MPIYYFHCNRCAANSRRLLPKEEECVCKVCDGPLTRDRKPLTTKVTEVLDNGIMVRSVERLVDAEEIYRERSRQDALENVTQDELNIIK